MEAKVRLLCCESFYPEVVAAVAAEGWPDVTVAAFAARCGRPPASWDELRALAGEGASLVLVIGRACIDGLGPPPADWPAARLLRLEECFDLVAGAALATDLIARGAYLMTSGWLADWRGRLRDWGFDPAGAGELFRESVRELVLLDTGVSPTAARDLEEIAAAVGLPATRLVVGLDHVRARLGRILGEWHLDDERRRASQREQEHARDIADQQTAMDCLGRLPLLNDEGRTITAIEEMLQMLFAPDELRYVRVEAGAPNGLDALPPELSRQVLEILARRTDWALTESGTGFLLRIARGGEPVGVVVLDRFEFPEHRGRYVNLALSIAGVAGLAIDNARTYAQVAGTQEALRKSEISLKLAQAMAHVGHWEVDVDTGEVRWSEETYRILGYEPGMLSPSYEAFTRAIHPADRQFVARHVDAARGGGGFDIEFRVVLPDARVRVLHGMGQMIQLESGPQRRILGTVQLVTPRERPELLGVLQDITNVKEMQWRLEQEARSDPLTGCANRRYFLELAGGEVARARRYPEEVSVLMLDLDHFKDINDRHGHAAGDLVLQRLVLTCRAALREEDAIGRLGGEEFAILLPQTGADRALEVAERLRVAVAGVEIAADGGPPIRFTTSIGVATLAEGDLGVGALLARADRALYEAKSRGRNRVVGAAGPPPRRRRASA